MAAAVNGSVNSAVNQSLMLNNWRNKSALQRFADDLEQRKMNLEGKKEENEERMQSKMGD